MKAILSKTTTDMMKSKVLSAELSQLVFDVYITPTEFGKLVQEFNEEQFELEIKHDSR